MFSPFSGPQVLLGEGGVVPLVLSPSPVQSFVRGPALGGGGGEDRESLFLGQGSKCCCPTGSNPLVVMGFLVSMAFRWKVPGPILTRCEMLLHGL